MYWKRLKAYVRELIVFTLFISLELFIFFVMKYHSLMIGLFIIWMIVDLSTFVPFSIRVVLDYFHKDYVTQKAVFIEEFPFKHSSFLDKNGPYIKGKGFGKKEILYFKVIIKCPTWNDTLTSSEYFELKPNTSYEFTYGKRSKALVDVKEVEQNY